MLPDIVILYILHNYNKCIIMFIQFDCDLALSTIPDEESLSTYSLTGTLIFENCFTELEYCMFLRMNL